MQEPPSQPGTPQPPAIVVLSSHVASGSVGNRALMFALERRGHRVIALPTILMPWHPGRGRATIQPMEDAAFGAMLDELSGSDLPMPIAGVISGYLASAGQAAAIGRFVDRLRARNPGLLYLCDPVIGDRGDLYRPQALVDAIASDLVPRADIVTPNRYELQFLTGREADDVQAITALARGLARPRVVVTSTPAMRAGHLANLLVTDRSVLASENSFIEGVPHGPGDLFSALLLSRLLGGQSDGEALTGASASVFQILAATARRGWDELLLAEEQDALIRPTAMVHSRQIIVPKPKG